MGVVNMNCSVRKDTNRLLALGEDLVLAIKRSTVLGLLTTLMISGACAASQQGEHQDRDARTHEESENDLVEVTIRLPDGRVIKRKEPRIASKIELEDLGRDTDSPLIVSKPASTRKVNTTKSAVSGGSNSTSIKTSGGSGGGGGGGSFGGGSGGGSGESTRSNPGGSNGQSGNTNGSGINPVQPDLDFTVRIYAWDNSGATFQHIQEAIVVDPRGKSPERLADRIAAESFNSGHDRVVLRFWKEFLPAERPPFDISNPRELIGIGGYSEGLTQYWERFARKLKANGVTPDYLIFDQEEGISFWHIPIAHRQQFFARLLDPDRQLISTLPPSMQGIRVEQFMNYRSQESRQAFNDYNQFASDFRAAFIRRVFYDTFKSVYEKNIPMSNYGDFIPGFNVLTQHNRVMTSSAVAGISAPVAYLDHRGENAPRYSHRSKNQRWNRLIDQLNEVRSSAQPGLTTPWIAPPGYGRNGPDTWARSADLDSENELWETLMSHMLAMGVDTFILWNPSTRFNPNARATDDMMDRWLRDHPRVSTQQLRDLPEIPLDADYIETNGVVTTYEQFLEMMNISE